MTGCTFSLPRLMPFRAHPNGGSHGGKVSPASRSIRPSAVGTRCPTSRLQLGKRVDELGQADRPAQRVFHHIASVGVQIRFERVVHRLTGRAAASRMSRAPGDPLCDQRVQPHHAPDDLRLIPLSAQERRPCCRRGQAKRQQERQRALSRGWSRRTRRLPRRRQPIGQNRRIRRVREPRAGSGLRVRGR